MKPKIEQFPATSQNTVLSVERDGTVLYSNLAGVSLLYEWGVVVGEKLPSNIGDFVQRVISRNSPEKMEVKVGKRVYLLVFHPLSEEECVNIYGFDIGEQKEFDERIGEREAREKANLELAEIIDTQAIQSLLNDFYKLAHIPMSIDDIRDNVLVGVGWQDICTKFHRVNPGTCKHCVESGTSLSTGISPGEFKLYKCKNNMWHIATPIMVCGQHIGNIFSEQFFFDDELLDYELFRSQARKYGFNEEEYIVALEKVPRLSRVTMDTGIAFLTKLAHMLSQLGYSNIKLSRSLAEHDVLVDALQASEEKYRNIVETANEGIWTIDAEDRTTYVNKKMAEILGYSREEIMGQSPRKFMSPEFGAKADDRLLEHLQGVNQLIDYCFIRKDGSNLWCILSSSPFFDGQGKYSGSLAMVTDITDRKR